MTDQEEEGWPLGLHPMNVRAGLIGNFDVFGSTSFSTLLLSGSPTSTDSTSDLDTESTGSFFHDKSTTLGSLLGVSRTTNLLSRRSVRRKRPEAPETTKKTSRPRTWCFSFCQKDTMDAAKSPLANYSNNNAPSLGQFLEVERRAANEHRTSHGPLLYELELEQPEHDSNSLFVNGINAPPHSDLMFDSDEENNREGLEQGNGCGAPILLFPCIYGHN